MGVYSTKKTSSWTQVRASFPWILRTGQINIIPKPELRGFGGDSLTKPPFKVTSAEVVIICQDKMNSSWSMPSI